MTQLLAVNTTNNDPAMQRSPLYTEFSLLFIDRKVYISS